MPFPKDVKEQLLVKCHRRCCLCHEYVGNKMEVHHIVPEGEIKDNSVENGIPLCFDCHAEVESYNIKHPKGNKFSPSELKKQRDQWFRLCAKSPWDSSPETPKKIPWNVPYRPNPNFTGRDEAMDRLHELLLGEERVVINQVQGISGMGGVGKTQLAVEYCHKYKEEYPSGVLWVRAERSVLEEFGTLGDELGLDLPETMEVRKQCLEVRRTLENLDNPGLLVLDNLDDKEDYEAIKDYLPTKGACRLLVTTRLNKLIAGDGIPLDVLIPETALKLLLKESGCENENGAGEGICENLGYLPLALELAGKYIGKTHTDLVKYLKRLEESGALEHSSLDGKGRKGATDHIASLRATLTVNKELLEDTQVQPVLAALTCFAPESINQEILGSVCDLEEEVLSEVIAQLEDYSLIQVQADSRLSLHRLLREALIAQLSDKSINNARISFIDKLKEWSGNYCNDVTKLKIIKPEVPHIIEAANLADKLDIWPQSHDLATRLGAYYYNLGRFHERLRWLLPLESQLRKKHSNDIARLARLLNNIGLNFQHTGDYDNAINYFEESLPLTKIAHGERHSHVAICLNNLGSVLKERDRHDQAIIHFEQAILIWKEVYGDEHPQVATGLNNLGSAWSDKGDCDMAIGYYEQALVIYKTHLSDRHPDVAILLNNIGEAWRIKGDIDKAIVCFEQALSIGWETYDDDKHPDIAIRLNNLGTAWYSKGEYDKARQYYQQSYDIKLEFLGEDHPSTKLTKENMEALPPA